MTESDQDSFDSADEEEENMMDNCVSLTYSLEIGEFHERDKFSWTEVAGAGTLDAVKCLKKIEFDFKMNHIKQLLRVEITGKFRHKKG
jgi:hypothetical protein